MYNMHTKCTKACSKLLATYSDSSIFNFNMHILCVYQGGKTETIHSMVKLVTLVTTFLSVSFYFSHVLHECNMSHLYVIITWSQCFSYWNVELEPFSTVGTRYSDLILFSLYVMRNICFIYIDYREGDWIAFHGVSYF